MRFTFFFLLVDKSVNCSSKPFGSIIQRKKRTTLWRRVWKLWFLIKTGSTQENLSMYRFLDEIMKLMSMISRPELVAFD